MGQYEKFARILLDSNGGVASDKTLVTTEKNTTISFCRVGKDSPQAIEMKYLDNRLIVFYDDQSILLVSTGMNRARQSRVNKYLKSVNRRVVQRRSDDQWILVDTNAGTSVPLNNQHLIG